MHARRVRTHVAVDRLAHLRLRLVGRVGLGVRGVRRARVLSMTRVAALFVDAGGVYPRLLGDDLCWPESRDAREYAGDHPVVAHPPCARWSRLAPSVFARTGKEEHRPAWLGGTDSGCFASALASVRKYGGVLEHPAGSHAWAHFALEAPVSQDETWTRVIDAQGVYWVCEVWQSAYGHKAPKRTWLLYCGARPPFELNWDRPPGTHVVAGDSAKRRRQGEDARPRLTGRENIATPEPFARELIRLAQWSTGERGARV